IGFDEKFLERPLNVDLSGGEKKRNETLQLAVLRPEFAILDELDSGLDVDALRMVSRRVEEATKEDGLGVLAITHYSRLFEQLQPDTVHVFADGRIQETGGPALAVELEQTGYERWVTSPVSAEAGKGAAADPFADPFA
ncbi:MAG: Fe-S cluster assembly ATPase SufC, partial [Actinomycetia bacterium]|nr:Fe-S cluster assembly ATPase SufC [Actinomycetes bacterium]